MGLYTSTTTYRYMVQCHKCGYEWDYTGGLDLATCPNCSAKVKVVENNVK